jgi:hypothetical protein
MNLEFYKTFLNVPKPSALFFEFPFQKEFSPLNSVCPDLMNSLQDNLFCRNFTFWSKIECNVNFLRCSANYAGQCHDKNNEAKLTIDPCYNVTDKIQCLDKSDGVCDANAPRCQASDMLICKDGRFVSQM